MYTTKTTKIDNGEGYWNYLDVEIFKDEVKIGEYRRNYSTLFNTFHPFTLDGKDYALYSKEYTATRVMSLPDCVDLGGEERAAGGFCPTDYYVPQAHIPYPIPTEDDPEPFIRSNDWIHKTETAILYPLSPDHPKHSPEFVAAYEAEQDRIRALKDAWNERHPFTEVTMPFGFVAGCYWGDDSSWKTQFLDLSQVSEGIIKRDDRFGYIELPPGVDLKDAIDMTDYDYDDEYINIAVTKRFYRDGSEI